MVDCHTEENVTTVRRRRGRQCFPMGDNLPRMKCVFYPAEHVINLEQIQTLFDSKTSKLSHTHLADPFTGN